MIPGGSFLLSSSFLFFYSASGANRNIFTDAKASGWDGNQDLTVTINAGLLFTATSTAIGALNTGAIPGNVLLTLFNFSTCQGHGGDGGPGGSIVSQFANSGGPGLSGGPAFVITTPARIVIFNAGGFFKAGGGGGGGGGGSTDLGTQGYGGSGGGAGIGGGNGGIAGTYDGSDAAGVPGFAGTASTATSIGAGGPSSTLGGGVSNGGAGGNGGGAGVAGASGGAGPGGGGSGFQGGAAGAGGNPGFAIALNGHSAPTILSGNDGTHIQGAIA